MLWSFCSAKVCSRAIFETSFCYYQHIWIVATDYNMHFYIIVLFPLTSILQLINFTAYFLHNFSLLIYAVILLLNCLVLILHLYIHFLSLRHHFSLLQHYLDLYTTDIAQKVSGSLYCFTTSISHGVKKYFPRLWGTGISDAIFMKFLSYIPIYFNKDDILV